MALKFSTGVPNCREGRLNPIGSVDRVWMRDVATAAERLGYYALWLDEFPETDPSVAQRFDDPPNYQRSSAKAPGFSHGDEARRV